MNKKQEEVTSEDLEIKQIAYEKKSFSQTFLLIILILLFTLTFFCTLFYIGKYYQEKFIVNDNSKLIDIRVRNHNIYIKNDGLIDKTITEEDTLYNNEFLITKENTITFNTSKKAESDGRINFNIKYNITQNDFDKYVIASTNNDVLVRFMYSFDNENWEYINNVITTTDKTINTLMGNYYDISGVVGNINVLTNYELTNKIGESTTMYWKCETLIKNIKNNINKNLKAEFKIEYQDSD